MDKIIGMKIRDRALNQARTEQAEAIQTQRMETFNTCLRMTAGVAFNAGAVDLSDGRIHEGKGTEKKNRNREQAESQAIKKRKQQFQGGK
jgi:hypothetical protein